MAYRQNLKIDLHIHSNASDGTLSPIEILHLAGRLNLGAIAITDHDTVAGVKDALAHGIPPTLKFLTGVEISVLPPPPFSYLGSFHILGYSIDPENIFLNQTLRKLQQARENRNPRILKILSKLGIDIPLAQVQKEAGESQLGRPHIARLMIKKGHVKSINEAFDRYLGQGKPAYVDKYRLECAKAIEMIQNAGGVPVLAHPFLIKIQNDQILEDFIVALMKMGLKGLEVYYPEHPPEKIAHYAEMARRHGLLVTGGTDFHGSLKPAIKMGIGKGNLSIPYTIYEQLVAM